MTPKRPSNTDKRASRSLRKAAGESRRVRKPAALRAFLASTASNQIAALRTGFMPDALLAMAAQLEVSQAEIFAIVRLAPSTAARISRAGRPLDQAVSERVARIARVWSECVDLFGSDAAARAWLKETNLSLGKTAPLQLLDTELGATEVRKVLAAIAHGGVV